MKIRLPDSRTLQLTSHINSLLSEKFMYDQFGYSAYNCGCQSGTSFLTSGSFYFILFHFDMTFVSTTILRQNMTQTIFFYSISVHLEVAKTIEKLYYGFVADKICCHMDQVSIVDRLLRSYNDT